VLRRYAGLDDRHALKLTIEHGLPLSSLVSDLDRKLALPLYLCQSSERAAAVEAQLPDVEAIPLGPLIQYAAAHERAREPEQSRLLLFPAHSVRQAHAEYDVTLFLERTAEYRRQFESVAACLYWRDVQLGRAVEYERHGLSIVTAGHMHDPSFLPRLYNLLTSATSIATNEVGTHVVYAAVLDRPVWIVPQRVEYRYEADTPEDELRHAAEFNDAPPPYIAELQRLFAEPTVQLSASQRTLAKRLAGHEHCRSSKEIAGFIRRAEVLYAEQTPRMRQLQHSLRSAGRRWLGR
jgi:hypothetical protein